MRLTCKVHCKDSYKYDVAKTAGCAVCGYLKKISQDANVATQINGDQGMPCTKRYLPLLHVQPECLYTSYKKVSACTDKTKDGCARYNQPLQITASSVISLDKTVIYCRKC